jgi:hypothetical protein
MKFSDDDLGIEKNDTNEEFTDNYTPEETPEIGIGTLPDIKKEINLGREEDISLSEEELLEEVLSRAESTVFSGEANKKGSGNFRELLASSMMNSKKPQDLETFDPQKNSNLLEKNSIYRHLIIKRIPDPKERTLLSKAYTDIYLPEYQERISDEFEIKDEQENRGLYYTGPYYRYLYEYKTAQNLVLFLEALDEKLEEEAKEEQKKTEYETWRNKTIEELRRERAKHGREIDETFFSEKIDYEYRGKQRSVALPKFAKRVGELLITKKSRGLTKQEETGLDFGLKSLRDKIKERFPERDDRALLLEEWVARENKARSELAEMERQYLRSEPTEKEVIDINAKMDELQGFIIPVVTAIRNSI